MSPCYGQVMEEMHAKQIYALDVECGELWPEKGEKFGKNTAAAVFIGFMASETHDMIGQNEQPLYYATIKHPQLRCSRTPFHSIDHEEVLEWGIDPETCKNHVLMLLSE